MRFLLRLIIGVVVLVAIAALVVPMLVPTDYMRDRITEAVRQQTGRELTVAGETSVSIIPDIGVRLGKVKLSNPPAMGKGTMLAMEALNVNLRLLPLLSQRIEVKQFVLDHPVFDLRVDKEGRRNWDFALAAGEAERHAEAGARAARRVLHAQAGGLASGQLQDLKLGDVRIVDGTVKYSDERSGTLQRIDAVNVKLTLPQISEPLEAEGTFDWQREQVAIEGTVASPQKLLANEASPVNVNLSSGHMTGAFKGEARLGGGPLAKGRLEGSSPSLRNFAAWLGSPVPTPGGFGAAKIASDVTATAEVVTLANLRLDMDGMKGQGEATLRLSGAKPHVRSRLVLDKLDLNVFLRPAQIDVRATPRPPSDGGAGGGQWAERTGAPASEPDQSLTDFIEQLNREDESRAKKSAPLVRGWSQRAIDFSGLALFDADMDLATGALFYDRIKIGKSVLKARVEAGRLTADLNELHLYDGQGRGQLTLYGDRPVPALGAAFNLVNVAALPIMSDALAFNWISGRANLTLAISGAGRSQNELVRSLQGNGTVHFTDGAIEGLNIPQMIRSISLGQLQGVDRNSRLKTDFSELSGTYTVQNGVVKNSDLQLVGPLVRMGGAGTVDLPREWIDFTLEPRLVASLEGQGGEKDLAGLVIPFKISGPLDNPGIRPDLERIMQSPEEAVKQLGNVVKNFKGNKKDLGKVLDNFLGKKSGDSQGTAQSAGDAGTQGEAAEESQKVTPKDLLNQFLR